MKLYKSTDPRNNESQTEIWRKPYQGSSESHCQFWAASLFWAFLDSASVCSASLPHKANCINFLIVETGSYLLYSWCSGFGGLADWGETAAPGTSLFSLPCLPLPTETRWRLWPERAPGSFLPPDQHWCIPHVALWDLVCPLLLRITSSKTSCDDIRKKECLHVVMHHLCKLKSHEYKLRQSPLKVSTPPTKPLQNCDYHSSLQGSSTLYCSKPFNSFPLSIKSCADHFNVEFRAA